MNCLKYCNQEDSWTGRLLRLLLKTGSPLKKNVLKPLAKSTLMPLELTAAASVADTGIHKKNSKKNSQIPDNSINNFKQRNG